MCRKLDILPRKPRSRRLNKFRGVRHRHRKSWELRKDRTFPQSEICPVFSRHRRYIYLNQSPTYISKRKAAYSLNQWCMFREISFPCGLTFKSNCRPVIVARFFRKKDGLKGLRAYMAGYYNSSIRRCVFNAQESVVRVQMIRLWSLRMHSKSVPKSHHFRKEPLQMGQIRTFWGLWLSLDLRRVEAKKLLSMLFENPEPSWVHQSCTLGQLRSFCQNCKEKGVEKSARGFSVQPTTLSLRDSGPIMIANCRLLMIFTPIHSNAYHLVFFISPSSRLWVQYGRRRESKHRRSLRINDQIIMVGCTQRYVALTTRTWFGDGFLPLVWW